MGHSITLLKELLNNWSNWTWYSFYHVIFLSSKKYKDRVIKFSAPHETRQNNAGNEAALLVYHLPWRSTCPLLAVFLRHMDDQ